MTDLKKSLLVFGAYYLPLIIWMYAIYYFSDIPGLKTGVEPIEMEIFLRKIAHLFEYFILALLFWRIFKRHLKFSSRKAGIISFILLIIYAMTDEYHQYFVEDRAGKIIDVFVDGAGGFLGIIFGNFLNKFKRKE